MSVDVIVGLQRGDEGKGRFVDLMAPDYDVVARGNGGANAGHTVVPDGAEPLALHQIPSGIAYSRKLNIIGNGVYVDPVRLREEIREVRSAGLEVSRKNLLVSNIAHLVMPHHVMLDTFREGGAGAQGSTKAGIAYVAGAKYLREGVRVEDALSEPQNMYELALEGLSRMKEFQEDDTPSSILDHMAKEWANAAQELKEFEADTIEELHVRLQKGQRALAEGAQGFWLDINHGMYPMVTSSCTTTAGLLDGLGVSHKQLGHVTGVAKITRSHVGEGPFVTEIHDPELATRVRGSANEPDGEYGTTTGRPRRVGYPDLVELRNAVLINGVDEVIFCKMDKVETYGPVMQVATSYWHNGATLFQAPSSTRQLKECEPQYEPMTTWPASAICSARNRREIPAAAENVLQLAEEELDVNIPIIGVGYERNQVVRL